VVESLCASKQQEQQLQTDSTVPAQLLLHSTQLLLLSSGANRGHSIN
jgi:hypothetical protein